MFEKIYNIMYFLFYKLLFITNVISEDSINNKLIDFIKLNGVIFIKLGQLLSSTASSKTQKLLGDNLFRKLFNFNDKCNQHFIQNDDNINYILKEPIASGSIAQVYKINYDDKVCALKTLVPNIDANISTSINNLLFYKKILYYYNREVYNLVNIFDMNEYFNFILKQTDLNKEAENLNKFKAFFKNTKKIIIPDIFYHERTKLIMSYEEGVNLIKLKEQHSEYFEEAVYLMLSFTYVCIQNKILHGDFHFGNFLFRIENQSLIMIVLDFGIIAPINDSEKELFSCLFDYTLNKDEQIAKTKELFIYLKMNPKVEIDLYNVEDSKDKNIHDRFDVKSSKIPINYISLSTVYPHFLNLTSKMERIPFLIKFFNFMYKNKFLKKE